MDTPRERAIPFLLEPSPAHARMRAAAFLGGLCSVETRFVRAIRKWAGVISPGPPSSAVGFQERQRDMLAVIDTIPVARLGQLGQTRGVVGHAALKPAE